MITLPCPESTGVNFQRAASLISDDGLLILEDPFRHDFPTISSTSVRFTFSPGAM
jgi:hypothetical protein